MTNPAITCNVNVNLCLALHDGNHAYGAAIEATFLELYRAISQCVEGVVLAHCYVLPWIVTCTTLAYYDVACYALLSTKNLYAQSLGS